MIFFLNTSLSCFILYAQLFHSVLSTYERNLGYSVFTSSLNIPETGIYSVVVRPGFWLWFCAISKESDSASMLLEMFLRCEKSRSLMKD